MPVEQKKISFQRRDNETLLLTLSGSWRLGVRSPSALLVDDELQKSREVRRIAFDSGNLLSWDSTLLAFLIRVSEVCRLRGIELDRHGVPAGVCKLLDLAQAVPEKKGARKTKVEATFVHYVGDCAIAAGVSLGEILKFTGEMTLTVLRLLRMKVHFRPVDLFLLIQQCGARALPIVTLISFLVGVILAFVGAVQLRKFGAQIYVADLLGIAVIHEMGAMMTGIIMASKGSKTTTHPRSAAECRSAALARAMALDPEILFFDEPSAGLDPITSRLLDDLIVQLRDSLGATIVVVTHELASIFSIGTNSIFLDPETKTIIAKGNPRDLLANSTNPVVHRFLTRGEEKRL